MFGTSLALLAACGALLRCTDGYRNASEMKLSWTGAEYRFECDTVDALLRDDGRYVPRNNIALRGQIYCDCLYLAYPRLRSGVPATLATTCLLAETCEALMTPYPCLSVQEQGKSGDIQNAVDLYSDAQDVLWVLDTGVVETLNNVTGPQRTGPPTVWAFDLNTRKLVKKIDLSCLTTPLSRLQYLVVDYDAADGGKCYVYVTDAANRALIVYDVVQSNGTRVILPKAIASGCTKRDVLYAALVRAGPCGSCASALIVTYLSGTRTFTIRTEYLRKGLAGKISDLGTKPDKIVILGTDGGTALFFRYESDPQVYRWDAVTPFVSDNFVQVYQSGDCFFATQVMADRSRNRLMVLETNFPDFVQNTVGCGIVHNVRVLEGCF